MKISKKSDYALILASIMAKNSNGRYLSLDQVAKDNNLPLPFLKQIAGKLTKNGLLESKEGSGGGYRLKVEARKIMVGDVIRAVEGSVNLTACARDGECTCKRESFCPSKTVWRKFWVDLVNRMDKTSLAEIDAK